MQRTRSRVSGAASSTPGTGRTWSHPSAASRSTLCAVRIEMCRRRCFLPSHSSISRHCSLLWEGGAVLGEAYVPWVPPVRVGAVLMCWCQ